MTATADTPRAAAPGPAEEDGGGPGPLRRLLSPRLLSAALILLVVAVAVVYGFRDVQPLRAVEAGANDRLRVILTPKTAIQEPRVSVLTIKEETLALFPYRSPVDRDFLADIITLLDEAGAKAIGLDILIDQATESEKDQRLIDAIRAYDGPLVLAFADERAGLRPPQEAFLAEFLERSGATPGLATVPYDGDGVVRRFHHVDEQSGVSGFPTAMLQVTGVEPPFPLDEEGGIVDWRRETVNGDDPLQTLPSHTILNPALPKIFLKNWFGDRYVMIGADLEQTDRHRTSLTVDTTIENPTNPGVLVHAHVLSQMLDGRVVLNWSLDEAPGIVVTAAMTALGVALGIAAVSLLLKLGGLVVFSAGFVGLAVMLSLQGGPYLPIVPPLLGLGVAFGLGASAEAFLSSREKAFIRQAFSHYLEPAMVDRLAKDRSSLRLGGERREISFIFTDVAGFTDMSEQLEPEVLAELLNEYFDGISDIIAAHDGSIDKFIGDAVVALFGALTSEPDHALNAVRCAEAMDAFAETFRKSKAHLGLGVTRIGVHNGTASVGNFGGRRRFDYTAMGDAMNTAARLESINKRLGTRVTVSEAARAAAEGHASPDKPLPMLRPVGRVMLKGKAEPVQVWNLDRETPPERRTAYEAAFEVLRRGPADAARELMAPLAADGVDPLARLHADRLASGESGDRISS